MDSQSILNDSSFAVVCSFLEKYGHMLDIPYISMPELQRTIESPSLSLKPLFILLLKKVRKAIKLEKWQQLLALSLKDFEILSQDDYELLYNESYDKLSPFAKVQILRGMLELQYEKNWTFKSDILISKAERDLPIGVSFDGSFYWYQYDREENFNLYKESADYDDWTHICSEIDCFRTVIDDLHETIKRFYTSDQSTISNNVGSSPQQQPQVIENDNEPKTKDDMTIEPNINVQSNGTLESENDILTLNQNDTVEVTISPDPHVSDSVNENVKDVVNNNIIPNPEINENQNTSLLKEQPILENPDNMTCLTVTNDDLENANKDDNFYDNFEMFAIPKRQLRSSTKVKSKEAIKPQKSLTSPNKMAKTQDKIPTKEFKFPKKCRSCDKNKPKTLQRCGTCFLYWHPQCLPLPAHRYIFTEDNFDWQCPVCDHEALIKSLKEKLDILTVVEEKRKANARKQERLRSAGIQLTNILDDRKPTFEELFDMGSKIFNNQQTNIDNLFHNPPRVQRTRKPIDYQFDAFDQLIDKAIKDHTTSSHKTVKKDTYHEINEPRPSEAIESNNNVSITKSPNHNPHQQSIMDASLSTAHHTNTIETLSPIISFNNTDTLNQSQIGRLNHNTITQSLDDKTLELNSADAQNNQNKLFNTSSAQYNDLNATQKSTNSKWWNNDNSSNMLYLHRSARARKRPQRYTTSGIVSDDDGGTEPNHNNALQNGEVRRSQRYVNSGSPHKNDDGGSDNDNNYYDQNESFDSEFEYDFEGYKPRRKHIRKHTRESGTNKKRSSYPTLPLHNVQSKTGETKTTNITNLVKSREGQFTKESAFNHLLTSTLKLNDHGAPKTNKTMDATSLLSANLFQDGYYRNNNTKSGKQHATTKPVSNPISQNLSHTNFCNNLFPLNNLQSSIPSSSSTVMVLTKNSLQNLKFMTSNVVQSHVTSAENTRINTQLSQNSTILPIQNRPQIIPLVKYNVPNNIVNHNPNRTSFVTGPIATKIVSQPIRPTVIPLYPTNIIAPNLNQVNANNIIKVIPNITNFNSNNPTNLMINGLNNISNHNNNINKNEIKQLSPGDILYPVNQEHFSTLPTITPIYINNNNLNSK